MKFLSLGLIAATLSSCSLWPQRAKPIEVVTKPVRINITQPAYPRTLDLREPYWYVVNDENLETFLEDVRKQSGDQTVFFAMTVADYELMAYNMQELRRYIREVQEVVLYYRTITENLNQQGQEEDAGN